MRKGNGGHLSFVACTSGCAHLHPVLEVYLRDGSYGVSFYKTNCKILLKLKIRVEYPTSNIQLALSLTEEENHLIKIAKVTNIRRKSPSYKPRHG